MTITDKDTLPGVRIAFDESKETMSPSMEAAIKKVSQRMLDEKIDRVVKELIEDAQHPIRGLPTVEEFMQ